ncbi:N-acetylmuramoyl-L-alanine amidase [Virgibacillus halophilus]|uniref:N-acetylmuramoyl-L-alanine amidase n=1 Tax=Tigheibacillus halophilus TaxID=361280 RepID=A0ABU5C6K7_9BACI|nr:N-acetylmuramoyl-L-alanine amidase [Virgibacillus halophilus]
MTSEGRETVIRNKQSRFQKLCIYAILLLSVVVGCLIPTTAEAAAVRIFIDPGHGGSDPGASANGLKEKDVTLDIALKTRDILNNSYSGHTIKLSRTSDVTTSLAARTNMANNWGANFFYLHTY